VGLSKVWTGVPKGNISFPPGNPCHCQSLLSSHEGHISLDQTTRIHGMIQRSGSTVPVWHELARPQIHGYDLLGVKFLNALKFASIADEKVTRVFEAPQGFVKMAEDLNVAIFGKDEVCGFSLPTSHSSSSNPGSWKGLWELPLPPSACRTRLLQKVPIDLNPRLR
jgi:hypothetical protein